MDAASIKHRFAFHPATTQEKKDAHEVIRQITRDAALALNEMLPDCLETDCAVAALELAMFYGNAALARNTE